MVGYDRAYNTIFDSNLTTFLVAFILFAIGTGPIKGFAVTLMIGIICSMFTAITVTRAIVQIIYGKRRNEKVEHLRRSMMTKVTQQPSKQYGRPDDAKIILFMKIAKPAAIFSILITLASIFLLRPKVLT